MLLTAALIAKHHPARRTVATTTVLASNNHRNGESLAVARRTQSPEGLWASYLLPTLVLRSLKASSQAAEMSGIEGEDPFTSFITTILLEYHRR